MKYFWIFLTVLMLNKLVSQSDTSRLHQVYYSFSNPEKAEWTAFENNWNYVDYSELKKTYKIKGLNCKKCESFYADLYVEINEAGEAATVVFLKGKICGQPIQNNKLSAEFENSVKSRVFKSLKNRRFVARFGNSLKC